MSKKWIIALLLLPTLHVGAQSIRLTRYDAPNALYLSFDRLFNYNLYEKARFELGFTWVSPNETAAQQRKVFGQWTLTPYVAYGTGDREWKYGLGTQLRLPGRNDVRLRLLIRKDLERAASRGLGSYRMLTPSYNTGYVASRFVKVGGGDFAVIFTPLRELDLSFGLRHTYEEYTFVASERRMFTEASMRADWRGGKSAMTANGGIVFALSAGRVASPTPHERYYVRGLLQYDADPSDMGLHVFGQLGFASQDAPYSRMFDLSGTAYTSYFFRNTFLTVPPNRFTANVFAHVCLNYTTPLPLWELSWSAPHPFLQLNAVWGMMLGQDGLGQRVWDGLPLQAPNKGLLEPATGFDGLVHWGLLDMGFGVAYQICPMSAAYMNENLVDNMAFAIVADFILDKYK